MNKESFYETILKITEINKKRIEDEIDGITKETLDLLKNHITHSAKDGKTGCTVVYKNNDANLRTISDYFTSQGFKFTASSERCIDGKTTIIVSWGV